MTVVATRGNLRLVDDGGGTGHLEGREDDRRPLDSFLKWGYWKPVDAVTAAAPLEGEGPLVRKYEQVLERNANRCRANYRRASRSTTAAGQEQNRNPQLDEVLDEQALSDSQQKALKAARERIARDAATAQAVQFGISFAVSSPYLRELVLAHAGRQAERIVAGTRDIVASIILDSLANGWTVTETADAIYEALVEAKQWQATMLARTDLIAMANGGSFAAAAQLAESAPVYKRWKNADDDRVRPTHVEAEDQLQPLQSPFIVGGAPLMFPGDPAGPDGEVINCRCTLVYLDDPAKVNDHLLSSAWDAMVSASWDESEHPREDAGQPIGGRFAKKTGKAYDPENAKGAGRFVGTRAVERIGRQLEQVREQLRALAPPVRTRADVAGVSETVYLPDGGFSFNIYDYGDGPVYGWSGGPADGHKTGFATADEALDDALNTLELEQGIVEGNWGKRLKGMVLTRKDAPAVHEFLDAAQAKNNSSPAWRKLADEWDVGDDEVVLNDPGLASFGKPDVSGFYNPGTDTVFLSGNELQWKMEPGAESMEVKPGMFSGGSNVAGLLRHEHGHAIWAKMTTAQLDQFRAMVPDRETRKQLTAYAAAAEEYYGDTKLQNDWRGEVMSEAIAVTTDPAYRREDWPDWVNKMGDWVQAQKRQR